MANLKIKNLQKGFEGFPSSRASTWK